MKISLKIWFEIFSKFLSQILKGFYNLSVAESPVRSNDNRRFLLKRQETRIVNNFWSRPNFYMKFSELYEKVHNLPDFCRISHQKVVHLKSDVHYSIWFYFLAKLTSISSWISKVSSKLKRYSILSFEMLQSMTVFLLVFTIMKGSWMAELGGGGPSRFSRSLFRSTRFLKAISWNFKWNHYKQEHMNLHLREKTKIVISIR